MPGLKWDAIDLERGAVAVKHPVTDITTDGKSMELAQDSAKTKSSLRTLPLVAKISTFPRFRFCTGSFLPAIYGTRLSGTFSVYYISFSLPRKGI